MSCDMYFEFSYFEEIVYNDNHSAFSSFSVCFSVCLFVAMIEEEREIGIFLPQAIFEFGSGVGFNYIEYLNSRSKLLEDHVLDFWSGEGRCIQVGKTNVIYHAAWH